MAAASTSDSGGTATNTNAPCTRSGQATRETNLDLWARWVAWLDKYLKQKDGKIAD